jgi:hypothetical protein
MFMRTCRKLLLIDVDPGNVQRWDSPQVSKEVTSATAGLGDPSTRHKPNHRSQVAASRGGSSDTPGPS